MNIPFAACLTRAGYERPVYEHAVICEYAHERLRRLLAGADQPGLVRQDDRLYAIA